MQGGVHPREVGAPYWPRVAWDGVRKKQLLDHDIIRLAGCVPQPPDSIGSSLAPPSTRPHAVLPASFAKSPPAPVLPVPPHAVLLPACLAAPKSKSPPPKSSPSPSATYVGVFLDCYVTPLDDSTCAWVLGSGCVGSRVGVLGSGCVLRGSGSSPSSSRVRVLGSGFW